MWLYSGMKNPAIESTCFTIVERKHQICFVNSVNSSVEEYFKVILKVFNGNGNLLLF